MRTSLAWLCAHGRAAALMALPSSPPQIHSPWLCMGGGLKSSLSLFDRCNHHGTRKDAKKDPESKEPPSSIKCQKGRGEQRKAERIAGLEPHLRLSRQGRGFREAVVGTMPWGIFQSKLQKTPSQDPFCKHMRTAVV